MNAAWAVKLVLCFTLCTWASPVCVWAESAAATAARVATLLALLARAAVANTTISSAASTVSNCTSGWYSVFGSEPCAKCRPGFFQPGFGSTACLACPNGTHSAAVSAAECRDCSAGTFSNGSACIVCPRGYFNANTSRGVTSCTACADGQYTAEPAPLPEYRLNCSVCEQGSRCTAGLQSVELDADESMCSRCIEEARLLGDGVCVDLDVESQSDAFYKCTCDSNSTGYYCEEDFQECASSPCKNGANCTEGPSRSGTFICVCTPGWQGTLCDEPIDYCAGHDERLGIVHSGAERCNAFVLDDYAAECDSFTNLTSYRCRCPTGHAGVSQCQACTAGKFSNVEGLCQCRDCAPGRYSNHSGQSICYECRRGYFCGHSNKTEVACSPGYHQHQRGQTECQVCQRGQFVPSWGSSAENCTVCPFGTFANREGSSVCNECPVGHECPSKSSDSVPCQPGFFQNQVAQTACKPCTDGTFTLSSAAVTCEETVPGMFSACRNEVPVYCPRGWFQNSSNASSCHECAIGRFTNASGQSVCQRCPRGAACIDKGANPIDCSPGFFSPGHDFTSCVSCPMGWFALENASTKCNECPSGHMCPAGDIAPIECSPGMYQAHQNYSMCVACEMGRFQPGSASTTCIDCPPGSRCGGTVEPEPCPVGYFQNTTGAWTCTICPAGRFNPTINQSECSPCPKHNKCPYLGMLNGIECSNGTFFPSGENPADSCLACPDDGIAYDGCPACPRGRFCLDPNDLEHSAAQDCGVGTFTQTLGQTICDLCPEGKFQSAGGASKCIDCTGTRDSVLYADEPGLSSCKTCPGGFSCQLAADPPIQCGAGTARQQNECVCKEGDPSCQSTGICSQRTCVACEEGKFSRRGQAQCTNCSVGTYTSLSTRGASECLDCEVGMFKDWEGVGLCTDCFLGQFQSFTGRSFCSACAEQTYANVEGLSACFDCTSGKQCNDPTEGPQDCLAGFRATDGPCERCSPGQFQNEIGQDDCLPCEKGWFADQPATSLCEACPLGYSCANSSETPVPCSVGFFADKLNSTNCTECPKGHACAESFAEPVPCSAGFFANESGMTACGPCPVGLFASSDAMDRCDSCAPGYFGDDIGMSRCTACAVGQFSTSLGISVCTICNAGMFAALEAQTACLECAQGDFASDAGSSVCDACPLGHECSDPAREPQSCPAGTFAADERSVLCDACPLGRYNTKIARAGCELCPAGFSCSNTSAVACPLGTFRNNLHVRSKGNADCSTCNVTASCSCDCLGEGAGMCDTEAESCLPCPPGKFNQVEKQSSCTSCDPGFECAGGSALARPCGYGTYASASGLPTCVSCAPGRYSQGIGESQCRQCEPGNFCAGKRLNYTQQPCPRGKHQPDPEQGRCTKCVVGRFEPLLGSNATECAVCGANTADDDDGEYKCSCIADFFMHVDDVEFYGHGFVLEEYSVAARCFQEPTAAMCLDLGSDSHLRITSDSGDCPFDNSYICRQVLSLSEGLFADDTVRRLDRISTTLKDAAKTQCLPCPSDGTECPAGTEFLDGRIHDNAVQSATGYWQDEDIYFDKLSQGGSLQTVPLCATQSSCDWPVFQNCFSASCRFGAWSACDGYNAGVLCRSCVDSTFCVDGASILNGGNFTDSVAAIRYAGSEDYTYVAGDAYFCSSASLIEMHHSPLLKKTGYNCTLCGEPDETVALKIGLGVGSVTVFIAVVASVAYVTRRRWWPAAEIALRTARSGKRRRSEKGQMASKVMLLMSYLQVQAMLLRPDTLETDFGELEVTMRWMKVANLDVTYAAGCSIRGNFAFNFFVYTLTPLVVFAFLGMVYFLLARSVGASKTRNTWPYLSAHCISVMLVLLCVIHTPVSRAVFAAFDCSEFAAEVRRTADGYLFNGTFNSNEEYLMSGESSGVQRLKAANYDMICWDSPRHQTIYYTASAFLLIYPIGIPVALLTLLFRQRRALDDTCDVACAACNTSELEDPASEFVPIFHESHLQHELSARDPRDFLRKGLHMPNANFDNLTFLQFSIFVRPYLPNKWPFEVAVMVHKLFLCCLILFINAGSPEQVATGMTEVVLFAGGMALWGPYTSKTETILFCLCQLSVFLVLLTAMFIKADFDNAGFLLDMLTYTTMLPIAACLAVIIWGPVKAASRKCIARGYCDGCLTAKLRARRRLRRQQEKTSRQAKIRRRIQTYDAIQRNGGQRALAHFGSAHAAIELVELHALGPNEGIPESAFSFFEDAKSPLNDSKSKVSNNETSPQTPSATNEFGFAGAQPLVALYDFHDLQDGASLVNFNKGDILYGFKKVNNGTWWIGHHIQDELTIGLFPCDFVSTASPEVVKTAKGSLLRQAAPDLSIERAVLAQAVPLSAVSDSDSNVEAFNAEIAGELTKHPSRNGNKQRSPKLRFQQKPVHAVPLNTPIVAAVTLGIPSCSSSPESGSSSEAIAPRSDDAAGRNGSIEVGSPKLKWRSTPVDVACRQGVAPGPKLHWKGRNHVSRTTTTSRVGLAHDFDSSDDASESQRPCPDEDRINESSAMSGHREVVVDSVQAADKTVFKLKHGARREQKRAEGNPRQARHSQKHSKAHMF